MIRHGIFGRHNFDLIKYPKFTSCTSFKSCKVKEFSLFTNLSTRHGISTSNDRKRAKEEVIETT